MDRLDIQDEFQDWLDTIDRSQVAALGALAIPKIAEQAWFAAWNSAVDYMREAIMECEDLTEAALRIAEIKPEDEAP